MYSIPIENENTAEKAGLKEMKTVTLRYRQTKETFSKKL